MRRSRGQALVELALCAPVLLVLALGAVGAVQVLEAQSGLQAATDAAVAAAARAPDAGAAVTAARSAFTSLAASYPMASASVAIDAGGFQRGSMLSAYSTAIVDVIGGRFTLHAHAGMGVELWRSRP
jgi:Flp pilus assembly protein TadG